MVIGRGAECVAGRTGVAGGNVVAGWNAFVVVGMPGGAEWEQDGDNPCCDYRVREAWRVGCYIVSGCDGQSGMRRLVKTSSESVMESESKCELLLPVQIFTSPE